MEVYAWGVRTRISRSRVSGVADLVYHPERAVWTGRLLARH